MKSICMTAVFLVMVLLTACQGLAEKKNVQSNETTSSTLRLLNTDQQKYQETTGETAQGIERWWLKRNENHQTPEVSDHIDLSKYDAYYVNPKCKKKKMRDNLRNIGERSQVRKSCNLQMRIFKH